MLSNTVDLVLIINPFSSLSVRLGSNRLTCTEMERLKEEFLSVQVGLTIIIIIVSVVISTSLQSINALIEKA